MDLTAALAADLTLLTQALDDPAYDIATGVRALAVHAKFAVPSYLGLSVVAGAPAQLIFTVLEEAAHARTPHTGIDTGPDMVMPTSLHFPMPPASSAEAGRGAGMPVTLTLYAAKPGAFVDLAADLAWLTGRDLAEFVVDQHRTVPSIEEAGGVSALAGSSLTNQAIGILIEHGHTPEAAATELDKRAKRLGTDPQTIAQQILDKAAGTHTEGL